jgi:hypothetical protein
MIVTHISAMSVVPPLYRDAMSIQYRGLEASAGNPRMDRSSRNINVAALAPNSLPKKMACGWMIAISRHLKVPSCPRRRRMSTPFAWPSKWQSNSEAGSARIKESAWSRIDSGMQSDGCIYCNQVWKDAPCRNAVSIRKSLSPGWLSP